MFDAGILKPESIVFNVEEHFYVRGYVNKQKYRYWGNENSHLSEAKSLHPVKVTAYAILSSKDMFLTFIESPTTTDDVYAELLQTECFPWARRKRIIKKIYFMQDGATSHRTSNVFIAFHEVYGTGLGYPKFVNGGMEWPP